MAYRGFGTSSDLTDHNQNNQHFWMLLSELNSFEELQNKNNIEKIKAYSNLNKALLHFAQTAHLIRLRRTN